MRTSDRVITFSVPLWDKELREKIQKLKDSKIPFSTHVCEALKQYKEKTND